MYVLVFLTLLSIIYLLVIRPWQQNWGATPNEIRREYPGDEVVKRTNFIAVRAIDIKAPPSEVWKWIIQIGCNRAGWYSLDFIDNGWKKSSDIILTQHQNIFNGQFIPFTMDEKNGMWVDSWKEHEYILWIDDKNHASWCWYLYEENGITRMVTKLRTKYIWKGFMIIYYLLFDIGDIIMMAACMKGIKKRAEKTYSPEKQ